MTFKALVYAYVLGGITFIPLVLVGIIFYAVYTSVPVDPLDQPKKTKPRIAEQDHANDDDRQRVDKSDREQSSSTSSLSSLSLLSGDIDEQPEQKPALTVDDLPKTRRGWLLMRRRFDEPSFDGSYVNLMRSFLDARSKGPKRSRPKDTWYVVLKGTVLYLYEDEGMTECEAALEVAGHEVVIWPEGLPDGELFVRRNAICLRPRKGVGEGKGMVSVTREMRLSLDGSVEGKSEESANGGGKKRPKDKEKLAEVDKKREAAREEAFDPSMPWFIFVRSNIEMEDWYLSLVHASDRPANSPTLTPLREVFQPTDMNRLVSTLDSQPDVIPMRWFNALIGRIFFSCYQTHSLEAEIIRRLMRKLSKVKRPAFLTDILVTEVAVGNRAPMFSKPMLKELTKEGDTALEVHLQYKGEVRITIEATATINLGARFKSYVVKLTLAVVLREIEGNLLIKVKRPPSNRIWYAFTQTPRMVLDVEPIVSDRQITWSMILNTIEARLKEIIQESVVMPNMDDISFFETLDYRHRGGIWSDAARRKKGPAHSEKIGETASAPELDTSAAPPSRELETPPPEPSKPAEELQLSVPPTPNPEGAITPDSGFDSVPPTPSRARARSWFPSVVNNEAVAAMLGGGGGGGSDALPDGDERRGRSTQLEVTSTSARSRSTPGDHGNTNDIYYRSESENTEHPSYMQETYVFPQGSQPERPDTAFSWSSRSSDASHTSRSNPSTSSFLSTLKSRAGDKQALSNSAKEAMRKLGVNWGGRRKDDMFDEVPDTPPADSRRLMDSMSNLSQRARASYTEVKAAVAERRGKDKVLQGGEDEIKGKERPANSNSFAAGQFFTGGSVPGTPVSRTHSELPDLDATSLKLPAPSIPAPSISRTSSEQTPTHGPEGQETGTPGSNDSLSPPAPIHTQPMQAKTMSIPGIHASHRGDVMSLGYVAPPPYQDNKTKKPAIQSVYRMWKNPVSSGEHQTVAFESSSQSQEQSDSTDWNKDVVLPLPPSPSPSTPPRPPPLPPRSTTASVLRPFDERGVSAESREGAPSASDTLKSIARRASLEQKPADSSEGDRSVVRTSGDESVETSRQTDTAPPLPPRRIQVPG